MPAFCVPLQLLSLVFELCCGQRRPQRCLEGCSTSAMKKSAEEKVLGSPYCSLSIHEAGLRNGIRLFTRTCSGKTKDKSFKLKRVDFD